MKRRVRLSTCLATSISTAPAIWLRKPCSAMTGLAVIPDRPSRRDARTSAALFPMDETIPSPVTTTRRIRALLCNGASAFGKGDLHVPDLVDDVAIGFHDTVGHAHGQAACLHR